MIFTKFSGSQMVIVCSRSTMDLELAMEKMPHVHMSGKFHTSFPFSMIVSLPELRANEEL